MYDIGRHQPLRLGPGLWPSPVHHPLVLGLIALVLLLLAGSAGWSLLAARILSDPRPEVNRFVAAAAHTGVTADERAALSAYRATLGPREQAALSHEINYLLYRLGSPFRFEFDARGEIDEWAGPPPVSRVAPDPAGNQADTGRSGQGVAP